ncbi:lipopolysaccharide core heptose(I) kinase RfaP [Candidatus Spongiihabitans sp.]|uniref:lipopolysaccharide core heptose(I) kinase RfaP n=1 Tax=Candidatus Spongiihabitans sp. TaxID=3101308 RepID=UPI003C7D0EB4
MTLHLEKEIADAWRGDDPFVHAQQQRGEIFRDKEGRRTLRFALDAAHGDVNKKHYFLKLHQGIGWGEVWKNLMQFRLPVIGARNEWLAIKKLQQLGVHTMTAVGYGRRGHNPARQLSFLITDELAGTISLATLCERWLRQPPRFALKRALIARVAEIARTLHENGVNHRDFYLCHFLIEFSAHETLTAENLRVYIIDLHRAQIRAKTPRRWIIKDLAGLYFSALDIGLTARDVLRFMKIYARKNTHQLMEDRAFWMKVMRRAQRLARRAKQLDRPK